MARIAKSGTRDHPAPGGSRAERRCQEIAADYGCSPANIYAILTRLRRRAPMRRTTSRRWRRTRSRLPPARQAKRRPMRHPCRRHSLPRQLSKRRWTCSLRRRPAARDARRATARSAGPRRTKPPRPRPPHCWTLPRPRQRRSLPRLPFPPSCDNTTGGDSYGATRFAQCERTQGTAQERIWALHALTRGR